MSRFTRAHLYIHRYSVTQFLLPFIVLVYTYTRICRSIWTSSKMSGVVDLNKKSNKASFAQRNRDPFISKAMINTVKQTIVVVTLYIVTNTPFIGCELWATWDPRASTSPFFTGKSVLQILSRAIAIIYTSQQFSSCLFCASYTLLPLI